MGAAGQPADKGKSFTTVVRIVAAALCFLCFFMWVMLVEHPELGGEHSCADLLPTCKDLVKEGKCRTNRPMMREQCVHACGFCGHFHANCVDSHEKCKTWAQAGECEHNPLFMVKTCQKSCGTCVACLKVEVGTIKEVLHVGDQLANGRPTFGCANYFLKRETSGLWTLTERATGRQVLRQKESTGAPYEGQEGNWVIENTGNWRPVLSDPFEEADCALQVHEFTLPPQVVDARKNLQPPREGVDYLADYDILHPKPAPPDYEYPANPAFLYPEEVRKNGGPDVPFFRVSNQPRAYYFPRFLSDLEADNIVEEATKRLERSGVVPTKGKNATGYDNVRTSFGCWLDNSHKSVENVRRRILAVTGFNTSQTEKLQVLRYEIGAKYESHLDYYSAHGARNQTEADEMWARKWNKNWNRAATFFLYLHDTEEGGETTLPRANGGPSPQSMRDCTKGLRILPRKGAAVLFYDMKPNKEQDPYSLHGGCPVVKGTKWAAPQWLHVKVRDKGTDDDFW